MPGIFGAFRRPQSSDASKPSSADDRKPAAPGERARHASSQRKQQQEERKSASAADTESKASKAVSSWSDRGAVAARQAAKPAEQTETAAAHAAGGAGQTVEQAAPSSAASKDAAGQSVAPSSGPLGRESASSPDDGSKERVGGQTSATTESAKDIANKKKEWTNEERVEYVRTLGLEGSGPAASLVLDFLTDSLANTALPKPWISTRDKRGRLYFVNMATRETSWQHPCVSMLEELAAVCKHCCSLASAAEINEYIHSTHGTWMQEAQAAMEKWFSAGDEASGESYYYHSETGETMWESPAEVIFPVYRTKLKAIAKLLDEEYMQGFDMLLTSQAKVPKLKLGGSDDRAALQASASQAAAAGPAAGPAASPATGPVPAPAHTSMADRTRAASMTAEQAESAKALPQKTRPGSAKPTTGDRAEQLHSNPEVAGKMDYSSSSSSEGSISARSKAAGAAAGGEEELDRAGTAHPSGKARAVPVLALGAAAKGERAHDAVPKHISNDAKEPIKTLDQALQESGQAAPADLVQSQSTKEKTAVAAAFSKRKGQTAVEAAVAQRAAVEDATSEQAAMAASRAADEQAAAEQALAATRAAAEQATAEHAAAEQALAEALREQEQWQADKDELLAEFRQALEGQKAQSLELRRREEMELEAQRARSARRREDWLVEQKSLRTEVQQMLEMQHEQSLQFQRQEVQRDEECRKIEQELRQAIANQEKQKSEDAYMRAEWEAQNQKLRDEVNEVRDQHADLTVATRQFDATAVHKEENSASKPLVQLDVPSGIVQSDVGSRSVEVEGQDWSFARPRLPVLVEPPEISGAPSLDLPADARPADWPTQGQVVDSQQALDAAPPADLCSSMQATSDANQMMQSQLADLSKEIAAQKEEQQSLLQQRAAQQVLAEDIHRAVNLHTEGLQEIREVLAQSRARDEAAKAKTAESQSALNEELLQELHRSLELQKSAVRDAQRESALQVQLQIEEALAAKTDTQSDTSAVLNAFEATFQSALIEKQREAAETNETMARALQAQVAEALAPLTLHVKDIERRQEEVSEVLAQQSHEDNMQKEQLQRSSAAADAMARQEAVQERLVQEVQEALELQKATIRETQTRMKPSIQFQVEQAIAESDAAQSASRRNFESEVKRALEDKQREVTATSRATAAALQQQVADALVPLTRHIQDVERRQDEDVSRARADEQRAQSKLEAELCRAREMQDRSLEMQCRMESAVQNQVSQALELFKGQLIDAERARTDDVERMRQVETTRRFADEDRESQKREERTARLHIQELEAQQRHRCRENDRLAEELRQAHEIEILRREADLRKELEWKVEKREMQWRVEHREIEWKSEVKQLEWEVDWQAVQLLEESELLRPSSAKSGQARSQSRVRENLFSALAASREDLGMGQPLSKSAGQGQDWRRRSRQGNSGTDEDGRDEFLDISRATKMPRPRSAKQLRPGDDRSSRPSSSSSRRSRRPTSATYSDHSLAVEVAADLGLVDPVPSQVTRNLDGAGSGRRHRQHHARETTGARLQRQHSTRWHELQHARQSDQQFLKAGGRSGSQEPVALTLDEICRAYPEVSQMLTLSSN